MNKLKYICERYNGKENNLHSVDTYRSTKLMLKSTEILLNEKLNWGG